MRSFSLIIKVITVMSYHTSVDIELIKSASLYKISSALFFVSRFNVITDLPDVSNLRPMLQVPAV